MRKVLLIFILQCVTMLYAQSPDTKRDYIWSLGRVGKSFLDFNTNPFIQQTDTNNFNLMFSNSSVSDTSGSLQFYTNGYKIMNWKHQLMENGDSLNYGTNMFYAQNNTGSSNGAIILPKPGSLNRYYIFHSSLEYDATYLYSYYCPWLGYTEVDMSANNGEGRVIAKNIRALEDTLQLSALTACRHANGRDWWILIRKMYGNHFYKVLVTPSGVSVAGEQVIGQGFEDGMGQAVFTPDGSKYIICRRSADYQRVYYNIYGFDRCTGLLSDPQQGNFSKPVTMVGCAVSPNSRYLYMGLGGVGVINQYDLNASNILSTEQKVAEWSSWVDSAGNGYHLGYMALAPDGKIYVSAAGSSYYLSTIENPDSGGLACNVHHHNIQLFAPTGQCMPTFPDYRLGVEVGSGCDTIGSVGVSPPIYAQSAVKVYPNPANETLHLHSETLQGNASVSLCNLLGQELKNDIWQNTAIEKELNLSHLPQGVYYLRILAGEKRFTYKIMKE